MIAWCARFKFVGEESDKYLELDQKRSNAGKYVAHYSVFTSGECFVSRYLLLL